MPLKWKAPTPDDPNCFNMFTCNSFGKLQIGSAILPRQVSALRQQKTQAIRAGQKVTCASGHTVNEFDINNAANNLQNAHARTEELLLTHIQTVKEGDQQREKMVKKIRGLSNLQFDHEPVPLKNPLSVFWFTPDPSEKIAPLIPLDHLELVHANHPEDLALDVVFDI